MAYGAGMLEANPGAIALVVLFFLVVTLGFEYFLHWLTHLLLRKRKMGLLAAVNKFSAEIMLLGLAVLLLNVCENKISATCYKIQGHGGGGGLQPWLSNVVGTDKVKGCACCLAKTEGVTECFTKAKGCPNPYDLKKQCAPDGLFKGIKHESEVLPLINPEDYDSPDKAAKTDLNDAAKGSKDVAKDATVSKDAAQDPVNDATVSKDAAKDAFEDAATTDAKDAANEKGASWTEGRRRLLAADDYKKKQLKCIGIHQFEWDECKDNPKYGPGWAPIVTVATLHQVHYLLFYTAVVHIVTGAIVLLLSTIKLKYYARRAGDDSLDGLSKEAISAVQAQYERDAPITSLKSVDSFPNGDGHTASDTKMQRIDSVGNPPSAFEASQLGGRGNSEANCRAGDVDESALREVPLATADPWYGRPEHMSFKDYLIEFAVYGVRMLALWNTVSRQEYAVLRASFYYSHAQTLTETVHHSDSHGGHSHDDHHGLDHSMSLSSKASGPTGLQPKNVAGAFRPYLTEQVERDGSEVVGLSVHMWLLLLLFVLVSGKIGWATWLFLILAGILLALTNVLLLSRLREMTRGGHVRRQVKHKGYLHTTGSWMRHFDIFVWMRRRVFLLGCIKLTLFFFTFVIANSIFMAITYGPESCFFSRTGFQRNPIPWWGIMLIDILLLLNLATFTLPLYSLTYHTRKVDRTLLQSIAKNKLRKELKQQQQKGLPHRSTLQRMKTGLRNHHAGATSRAERGQARMDATEPQSDNAKWQQMQEALSV